MPTATRSPKRDSPISRVLEDTAVNPITLQKILWPDVTFYREQRMIIESVWNDDQTFVKGANDLGKDFVAAYVVLAYFITRHPCKIITTSVKDKHLGVLWADIEKFLRVSRYPLLLGDRREEGENVYVGNTLTINAEGMHKIVDGKIHRGSYVMKLVATDQSIESFLGHHVTPDPGQPIDKVPRNLFVGDEASGLKNDYYKKARTWAKRMLLFGNTWPCNNFFRSAFQGTPDGKDPGGDVKREYGEGFFRRTITMTAEDSPNVRLGIIQEKSGQEPTDEQIVPGVKTFLEYKRDRKILDKADQCVVLDAVWYEGEEIWLFPEEHRQAAIEAAANLVKRYGALRPGKTMGVDTAEGGDNSSWTVADLKGFVYQKSMKTPDTSVIPDITIELMREFRISPENVAFDAGGGGYEHACELRKRGYNVTTIGFGESAKPEIKRGLTTVADKKKEAEIKYVYVNRRAEMYGMLSLAIHPGIHGENVYGIPASMSQLIFQLSRIPKKRDQEGRLWLPPKDVPAKGSSSGIVTLKKLIGHSPDEADSAVLAYFKLFRKASKPRVGVAG